MSEVIVVADDREKGSDVINYLRELGAKVYIRRLEIGDYIVADNVAFERKSANDFLSSVIDGRLFEQAINLKKAFQRGIIIIEGNLDKALMRRELTKRHVLGALGALALMGVSTVFTNDEEETAYLIFTIAKKLQVKEKRKVIISSSKMKKIKGKTLREEQLSLLASLPGISYELAERILEVFGCPRKFFIAHPYEWKRVKGLGEKKIKRLIELLDYNPLAKEKEKIDITKYLSQNVNQSPAESSSMT